MMRNIIIAVLLLALLLSINLNLFQWRNEAVTCEHLDKQWKAELLFKLGHKHLDKDKNGIPCENLLYADL